MERKFHKISLETQALLEALKRCTPGKVITFTDFSESIGRDIDQKRSCLSSALLIAERDHGLVFTSVHSVGYQLLEKTNVAVTAAEQGTRRMRSNLRAWERKIKTIDVSSLSVPDQARAVSSIVQHQFLAVALQVKTLKNVQQAAIAEPDRFKVADVETFLSIGFKG